MNSHVHRARAVGWGGGPGCLLFEEAAPHSLAIHGLCPDILMPGVGGGGGERFPRRPLCGPPAWCLGQELEPRLRYELQEKRVPARRKEHIESLIKAPANCQGSGLAARPLGRECYLRVASRPAPSLPSPSVLRPHGHPPPPLEKKPRT